MTQGKGTGAQRRTGQKRLIAAVALGTVLSAAGTTAARADIFSASGAFSYTSSYSTCVGAMSQALATAYAGAFTTPAPQIQMVANQVTSTLMGATPSTGPTTPVVVSGLPGISVGTLVACAGAPIASNLPVVNGVLADLPSTAAAVLQSIPGVSVTPDATVGFQSTTVSTGPHPPSAAFLQETGAAALTASGDNGQGVAVAVLDTGIDNLPDFSGRLIGGVDFAGDKNPYLDGYGHGTFVAGLIAGNGASSGGQYTGEAPAANLFSVKVAGASGQTDVATIIKGIGWVVNHKKQYNFGVLNLSLGYEPTTPSVSNALDQAVEAAWNAGIAVVTSAGNAGPFNGTILSPGDDPLAITVGALDDMATTATADDEVNDFSSAGPTAVDGWVKPDLVTSGRSVVSVAAPNSTIWTNNPSARMGSANFVGSGTSFSAAITSGAAALVLAANPGLTPNQLKARLLGTAAPGPLGNPFVDGHGALNVQAAAASTALNLGQSTYGLTAPAPGTTISLSPAGTADSWNPAIWTGAAWNGAAWNGAAWNGAAWNGAAWNGAAWNGAAWNSGTWSGAAWNGAAWNGAAWNGAAWNGGAWNGAAWNGAAWNGAAWNGAAWNGAVWN